MLGLYRKGPGGLLSHLGCELRQALAVVDHLLDVLTHESTLKADEIRHGPAGQKIIKAVHVLQQA